MQNKCKCVRDQSVSQSKTHLCSVLYVVSVHEASQTVDFYTGHLEASVLRGLFGHLNKNGVYRGRFVSHLKHWSCM